VGEGARNFMWTAVCLSHEPFRQAHQPFPQSGLVYQLVKAETTICKVREHYCIEMKRIESHRWLSG